MYVCMHVYIYMYIIDPRRAPRHDLARGIPRVRTLGCGSFGRVRFAKYKPELATPWALGVGRIWWSTERSNLTISDDL